MLLHLCSATFTSLPSFLVISFVYKTPSQGLILGKLKKRMNKQTPTNPTHSTGVRCNVIYRNAILRYYYKMLFLKILAEFSRQNPDFYPCPKCSERINLVEKYENNQSTVSITFTSWERKKFSKSHTMVFWWQLHGSCKQFCLSLWPMTTLSDMALQFSFAMVFLF